MPELPEVHTITKDLARYAENSIIKEVKVNSEYKKVTNVEDLKRRLVNNKVTTVSRIAKNIILELSSGEYIVVHLAMTGRLLLRKQGHPADGWERVSITLEKKGNIFELRYCDMRMFGKFDVLNQSEFNNLLSKYGPEPLNPNLTDEQFLNILISKKSSIKNVLLDQSKIAGMGNAYVTDALWIAKIHPTTHTTKLTKKDATNLLKASREMLNEGIKNRGISMSDYVDLFGKKGNQQNFFRIYSKTICTKCNNKVEFIKINNRGTYFCPECQPLR
jgi:formamidopyrimidine-DNA glycosylase